MVAPLDYSIDIVNLSKKFRRQTLTRGYTSLKSAIVQKLKFKASNSTGFSPSEEGGHTHAIKNLTMRIPRGKAYGIIGQNGSGKSTLLKLVTGIYQPDHGTVTVNGRIAALIELGAGFHPDFSGRENVYLSGVMYGLSRKEIDSKFDEIVHFAELEAVIDDPVRTYSSGMFMRLGFSIAVHTDPDVLLVDEVLAVGDATFSHKCKDKLAELKKDGRTFLLVSHDLGAVERWCDEVLWLHRGEVKDRGDPRRVIDHYREFVEAGEAEELKAQNEQRTAEVAEEIIEVKSETIEADVPTEEVVEEPTTPKRWGSREVEISSYRLIDEKGEEKLVFHPDDTGILEIEYIVRDPTHLKSVEVVFGVGIHRSDGLVIHGSNTDIERAKLGDIGKHGIVRYEISRLGLLEGVFRLDVACHRLDGYPYDYIQGALNFSVRSPIPQIGVCVPAHSWSLKVNE